jgi:hypothetical protein
MPKTMELATAVVNAETQSSLHRSVQHILTTAAPVAQLRFSLDRLVESDTAIELTSIA